jgi:hypothetical protein
MNEREFVGKAAESMKNETLRSRSYLDKGISVAAILHHPCRFGDVKSPPDGEARCARGFDLSAGDSLLGFSGVTTSFHLLVVPRRFLWVLLGQKSFATEVTEVLCPVPSGAGLRVLGVKA